MKHVLLAFKDHFSICLEWCRKNSFSGYKLIKLSHTSCRDDPIPAIFFLQEADLFFTRISKVFILEWRCVLAVNVEEARYSISQHVARLSYIIWFGRRPSSYDNANSPSIITLIIYSLLPLLRNCQAFCYGVALSIFVMVQFFRKQCTPALHGLLSLPLWLVWLTYFVKQSKQKQKNETMFHVCYCIMFLSFPHWSKNSKTK